ncbi:unnamed protein product [Acanthoscelides obtectus]|nr:unnamed protein product [Acanthoscelides obtectus]CAK1684533.1 hypothetical protein AOBTE_LOCUS34917 [Acanthoscelides obtectus]
MTKVPIKDICFLHERFAELPAQAIRCRLADICPTQECVPWSHDATVTFRNMTRDRTIDAKVARINRKEQILEVYLIDVTNPSKPFCINTRLVELGLATYPDQVIIETTRPVKESKRKVFLRLLAEKRKSRLSETEWQGD